MLQIKYHRNSYNLINAIIYSKDSLYYPSDYNLKFYNKYYLSYFHADLARRFCQIRNVLPSALI